MIGSLRPGDTVTVWPVHARVPRSPETPTQFLAVEGAVVQWNDWFCSKALDGSIFLTDPRPRLAIGQTNEEKGIPSRVAPAPAPAPSKAGDE